MRCRGPITRAGCWQILVTVVHSLSLNGPHERLLGLGVDEDGFIDPLVWRDYQMGSRWTNYPVCCRYITVHTYPRPCDSRSGWQSEKSLSNTPYVTEIPLHADA